MIGASLGGRVRTFELGFLERWVFDEGLSGMFALLALRLLVVSSLGDVLCRYDVAS